MAQSSFISSTNWTERIGPTAALATISKMKENHLPSYLCKIGNLILDGGKKLGEEHGINLEILDDVPPLATFNFVYDNSQALHTLFTQEMLEKGYLALKSVYVSFSHDEAHIKKYLEKVDDAFTVVRKAIDNDNVYSLLKGPVAHQGFKRLT